LSLWGEQWGSDSGTDVTPGGCDVSLLKHCRRTGATRLAQSVPYRGNPTDSIRPIDEEQECP
jgi:hypothetical protein